ncbi:MAG: monovalent cation/H(+) antiporter subunit G [Desulfococcaceae bacterium]
MLDILSLIVMAIGVAFILVAALGVLRMPDLFLRMSTTTKAATLGVGLVFVGAALAFRDLGVTIRAAGVVIFLLLTAPVGAHMLGRAAHLGGVPLWENTIQDELREEEDG